MIKVQVKNNQWSNILDYDSKERNIIFTYFTHIVQSLMDTSGGGEYGATYYTADSNYLQLMQIPAFKVEIYGKNDENGFVLWEGEFYNIADNYHFAFSLQAYITDDEDDFYGNSL